MTEKLKAWIVSLLLALSPILGLADVREDEPLWNCHVHGNQVCGPEAPWHGFVNIEDWD